MNLNNTKIKSRKSYTKDFKLKMVNLYIEGHSTAKQIEEIYEVPNSTLHRWIGQYTRNKSFNKKDDYTSDQVKIFELEKQLKAALRENEILKQAALILGQKLI